MQEDNKEKAQELQSPSASGEAAEKPQGKPASGGRIKYATTLDDLEWGDNSVEDGHIAGKRELPAGVESRSLYKDITRITWPSLVELLLTQMTSMADLMMVGQLGAWAIAAVGLTTQPKFLLTTIFMALNVGAMAMVARYRGAGNQEKAKLILRQSLMMNCAIALFCAVIGVFFAEDMVRFMAGKNSELAVIQAGTDYLKIQMLGIFTMALTSTITNTLRGSGDSRTAMIYNTMANVVNVVFNYLLIYGKFGFPMLGVAGASLATVIGQFVACLMAFYAITRPEQYVRLRFSEGFMPDMEAIRDITRIGIPTMVERSAMRVGMIIYQKTISSLGTDAFATHQICMNIQALTFMNGEAFSVAATALVGQSLGKRRPDMAVHYANRTQRMGMFVSICIATVVFFFNKTILGLYTDDLAIIMLGGSLLQMIALIQPLQASQFIFAGVLRGAGDTKYTATVSFLTVMILRPGLALLAVNYFNLGLTGAWYALVTDQLIRTLLIGVRYYSGKWRHVVRHDAGKKIEAAEA